MFYTHMPKKKFIPGLELNEGFYHEVVGPLMEKHFPRLQYSAGLIGHGSDVVGFDSPTSMDHDWGPRSHLVFTQKDFEIHKAAVDSMLRKNLPYSYKGFPTNFVEGDRYLKHKPKLIRKGEVNHLFNFWTIPSFFDHYLGFNIHKKPMVRDWLTFPQQALIEVTSGKLFRDDLGLDKVRGQFTYYPDDVWKYMMRVQWGKLIDELQMQARTGEEGDEVGSVIVAARTVHKVIFLCFLLERTYAPYSKWYGSAFRTRLRSAKKMYPLLLSILREKNWPKRQKLIAKAYQMLGVMHNNLHITRPLSTELTDFFGRGYSVIDVWEYVHEIEKVIEDPKLARMKYPLGAVDQFIDHARINQLDYVFLDLKNVIK
jgi:hypothetical protein